jgi:hypothetical protein
VYDGLSILLIIQHSNKLEVAIASSLRIMNTAVCQYLVHNAAYCKSIVASFYRFQSSNVSFPHRKKASMIENIIWFAWHYGLTILFPS